MNKTTKLCGASEFRARWPASYREDGRKQCPMLRSGKHTESVTDAPEEGKGISNNRQLKAIVKAEEREKRCDAVGGRLASILLQRTLLSRYQVLVGRTEREAAKKREKQRLLVCWSCFDSRHRGHAHGNAQNVRGASFSVVNVANASSHT